MIDTSTQNSSRAQGLSTAKPSQRLMSIDALRGFDMFWIIGAGALVQALQAMTQSKITKVLASQLEHRPWEGFAFEDLIFPLFVFIVGVSMVFSLGRTIAESGRAVAFRRITQRSLLLFVVGLIYSGGFSNEWPNIRLLGVVNRIALCYFFAGTLFLFFRWRGLLAACVALLVGYWAMMTLVNVPDLGPGHFEKGRNFANYIDSQYLGGKRYNDTWDPEGLLSTLPAIASCLLGALAGLLLQSPTVKPALKVRYLLGAGVMLASLGWLWHLQFPVIKSIWTSSFVLVAGGYSALFLGVFYLVVDVWKYQAWAQPFVWIGMNSITIYLANNIIGFGRLANRLAGGDVKHFLNAHVARGFGDLVLALVGLALAFGLARFLYRHKIFLRL